MVICLKPSLGPKVEKNATGSVERRLKNNMVNIDILPLKKNVDGPKVPRANVEIYARKMSKS